LARWALFLQQYKFKLIHRKGTLHGDADAISRPVINSIEFEEDVLDSKEINTDPHEDDALKYFLKFKKCPDGLSNKQSKRVKKLAPHFIIDGSLLKYRKNKDSQDFKTYPARDERIDIISNAHTTVGHHAFLSTYNRVYEKYYWKNMRNDIIKFCSNCSTCLRHDKVIPLNHPALSIQPEGILDRIAIDLVFGLDETPNGYIGLCVITEFVSQFPFVYPIKSKEAKEIAVCLLDYISINGVSREICMDNGVEFINQVVSELLLNCNIARYTTSIYNPRTNGKTEGYNKDFVKSLKKICELDRQNWPKYIPFALLAYRTRVHSVTKFTPFRLYHGREANLFETWSDIDPSKHVQMIINRALQIKEWVEEDQPNALINIKHRKDKQMVQQNKQNKMIDRDLEIGEVVFLKIEGILKKLDPKYAGPYKILRQTNYGNYEIIDPAGNQQTVPLSKLKLTQIDKDLDIFENSDELDKIINHRKVNNEHDYKVKWKNDKSTSWIKESDFNTFELLNKYKKEKLHETKQNTNSSNIQTRSKSNNNKQQTILTKNVVEEPIKQKRGRPAKNNLMANFLTIITIWMFLFGGALSFQIKDNFLACNVDDSPYWDEQSECSYNNPTLKLDINETTNNYIIYSKMHDVVSGDGYQCSKKKIVWTMKESFFADKVAFSLETTVKLDRNQCYNMVNTKTCGDEIMECSGNTCWYTPSFDPTKWFKWNEDVIKIIYSCHFTARTIIAEHEDSVMFGSTCKPADLYCTLHDSTIVWDTNIIHANCPFKIITTTSLTSYNNYLFNEENRMLFQLNGHSNKFCDTDMFLTTEGVYLIKVADKKISKLVFKPDVKAIED